MARRDYPDFGFDEDMDMDDVENEPPGLHQDDNWAAMWIAHNNGANEESESESEFEEEEESDDSADLEVGRIFHRNHNRVFWGDNGFVFPVSRKRDHDEIEDPCDAPRKVVIFEADLSKYPEEVFHIPGCKCFGAAEAMEQEEVVLGFNDIDTP